MDTFLVYLIFTAEGIKNQLSGGWQTLAGIGGLLFLAIFWIYSINKISEEGNEYWTEAEEKNYNRFAPKLKKAGIFLIILSFTMGLLSSTIPNAKQSAVIYIIPKIIHNENMTQVPDNLAKLVNEGLKELASVIKEEGEYLAGKLKEETKEALFKEKANTKNE